MLPVFLYEVAPEYNCPPLCACFLCPWYSLCWVCGAQLLFTTLLQLGQFFYPLTGHIVGRKSTLLPGPVKCCMSFSNELSSLRKSYLCFQARYLRSLFYSTMPGLFRGSFLNGYIETARKLNTTYDS